MSKKYIILLDDLVEAGTPYIIFELKGHKLKHEARSIAFPDEFYVLIDLSDEGGINYYTKEDKLFLDMDWSAIGFLTTVALLKKIGKEVHFSNQNE